MVLPICIRFNSGCIIIVKKLTKNKHVTKEFHISPPCGNLVILMINIIELMKSTIFFKFIYPTPDGYNSLYDLSQNILDNFTKQGSGDIFLKLLA